MNLFKNVYNVISNQYKCIIYIYIHTHTYNTMGGTTLFSGGSFEPSKKKKIIYNFFFVSLKL